MFLIFDTETTGKAKSYSAGCKAIHNWPRCVQLAWQLHDFSGKLIEIKNYIIYPENFIIPLDVSKIHGITTKRAKEEGHSLSYVLNEFYLALQKCKYIIAHNITFDVNVIFCEFYREAILRGNKRAVLKLNTFKIEKNEKNFSIITDEYIWKTIDTCSEESAFHCKLKGGRFGKYKFPKLIELYKKLFGTEFDGAHNASIDVSVTARCFFELLRLKIINSKEIFSKEEKDDFFKINTEKTKEFTAIENKKRQSLYPIFKNFKWDYKFLQNMQSQIIFGTDDVMNPTEKRKSKLYVQKINKAYKKLFLQSENLDLDKDNKEFDRAVEIVLKTNKNIFLTGKAGTGKTTFLKYIKEQTKKNCIVLAPTGVAAINAKGKTINSFFQIDFSVYIPNDSRLDKENFYTNFKYDKSKQEIIKNLDTLIIDEISMVRCDIIDLIDKILKIYRRNQEPFGGIQLALIGDVFQLPPILIGDKKEILSQFYKSGFFFESNIIKEINKKNDLIYIELKKIYRQKDEEFINMLNRIRVGEISKDDIQKLNLKHKVDFEEEGYIHLCTHNKIVDETNQTKLQNIQNQSFCYEAKINGTFPEKSFPTERELKLKVGAQIMFIKNTSTYYNGQISKISKLEENKIWVKDTQDEEEKLIEIEEWSNIKYTYNKKNKTVDEEVLGTFKQFPLKLAWAITVHKSQGKTFEKVYADLGQSFERGQVYVALSRSSSFKKLVLKTKINPYHIKVDKNALDFSKKETPETLLIEKLNEGKADFLYNKAKKYFEDGEFKKSFKLFKEALNYRNDINPKNRTKESDLLEKFLITKLKRFYSFKPKKNNIPKKPVVEKSVVEEAPVEKPFVEKPVVEKPVVGYKHTPSPSLQNTSWEIIGSTNKKKYLFESLLLIRVNFKSDGSLTYAMLNDSGNQTLYYSKPKENKWTEQNNIIKISINNNYLEFNGEFTNNKQFLYGSFINQASLKGKWFAVKKITPNKKTLISHFSTWIEDPSFPPAKIISTWEIFQIFYPSETDNHYSKHIINFKNDGTFEYTIAISVHKSMEGTSYNNPENKWFVKDDILTISFNNGYQKLKGKLVMNGEFLIGNSKNKVNLEGSWMGRRLK